jgi:hypothetical protein
VLKILKNLTKVGLRLESTKDFIQELKHFWKNGQLRERTMILPSSHTTIQRNSLTADF